MHVCFRLAGARLRLAACTPAPPFAGHTPAIRQAAKQTDEVNRERCFLASSEMWLRQSQTPTPTLDTAWQPTCCRRRRGAHMITRQIMFVNGDSDVTALARQNRGVDLTVQSSCSPQIIVTCFVGGGERVGRSQFLSLTMCVIQSLRWTMAIMDHKVKTPLLNCNFYPWFSLYWLHFSHISPHCHPDRQCESTACWLTEFLARSSRGWSKGVSVSR